MLTLILSVAGCALLFLGIWGVTITMPAELLAQNFPRDVQEALKPRLERISRQPITFKRILGWQNFGYNRKQQMRQCILIVIGSAVTAWIFSLL